MPRARTFRALLLGAILVVAGCSEMPTAPVPEVSPSAGLLDGLIGTLRPSSSGQVAILERTVPLARDEVVSQNIGWLGGVIRLPRAGLTVVVPIGAVMRPTRITVTAPAGNLVGYDFQPHGLRFERPLTLTQDLLSTKGLGLLSSDLQAVYFEGDLAPTVTPLETLPVWVLNTLGIYRIEHFSSYAMARRGYVVATD
jgi:hypothetical protein